MASAARTTFPARRTLSTSASSDSAPDKTTPLSPQATPRLRDDMLREIAPIGLKNKFSQGGLGHRIIAR
jgi:hypothetical protein